MARTKVWVAGPRSWENVRPIKLVLAKLVKKYGKDGLLILQGEAPGVDTLAKRLAQRNGIWVAGVEALWGTHGRAAGPQRNGVIAGDLAPDLLVAFYFWKSIMDHAGTRSAVITAHENKIPVKLIRVRPETAMPSSVADSAPGAKARERRRVLAAANGRGKPRKTS